MSAFSCPRCAAALQFERMGKLRRWHCSGGHGEALTVSTLRQLIPLPRFRAWWLDARVASGGGVGCPSCGQAAASVLHSVEDDVVELDLCKRCQIVWMDQGERSALGPAVAAPAPAIDPNLSPEAREALLRLELERVARDTEHRLTEAEAGETGPGSWRKRLLVFDEADAPTVHQPPVVSWLVLALTAVGFGASILMGWDGVDHWGLWLDDPLRERGLPVVVGAFLSPNPFHFLATAWVLWTMGDNVEDVLGPGLMLLLIASAHGVMLASQWLLTGGASPPLVGLSASLAAIACFYALRFPQVRFRMWDEHGGVYYLPAGLMACIVLGGLLVGAVSDGDATATWIGPLIGAGLGLGLWVVVGRGPDARPDEAEPLL